MTTTEKPAAGEVHPLVAARAAIESAYLLTQDDVSQREVDALTSRGIDPQNTDRVTTLRAVMLDRWAELHALLGAAIEHLDAAASPMRAKRESVREALLADHDVQRRVGAFVEARKIRRLASVSKGGSITPELEREDDASRDLAGWLVDVVLGITDDVVAPPAATAKIDPTKEPPPAMSPGDEALRRSINRAFDLLQDLVQARPHDARKIAYGALGQSIAMADTFGVDVEKFLADLRRRFVKPMPLVFNGVGATKGGES